MGSSIWDKKFRRKDIIIDFWDRGSTWLCQFQVTAIMKSPFQASELQCRYWSVCAWLVMMRIAGTWIGDRRQDCSDKYVLSTCLGKLVAPVLCCVVLFLRSLMGGLFACRPFCALQCELMFVLALLCSKIQGKTRASEGRVPCTRVASHWRRDEQASGFGVQLQWIQCHPELLGLAHIPSMGTVQVLSLPSSLLHSFWNGRVSLFFVTLSPLQLISCFLNCYNTKWDDVKISFPHIGKWRKIQENKGK